MGNEVNIILWFRFWFWKAFYALINVEPLTSNCRTVSFLIALPKFLEEVHIVLFMIIHQLKHNPIAYLSGVDGQKI